MTNNDSNSRTSNSNSTDNNGEEDKDGDNADAAARIGEDADNNIRTRVQPNSTDHRRPTTIADNEDKDEDNKGEDVADGRIHQYVHRPRNKSLTSNNIILKRSRIRLLSK